MLLIIIFVLILQSFEQYLLDQGCGSLLKEERANNGLLDKSRKKLVNQAVQFTVSIFGNKPRKGSKELVAAAVVEIFPSLSIVTIK